MREQLETSHPEKKTRTALAKTATAVTAIGAGALAIGSLMKRRLAAKRLEAKRLAWRATLKTGLLDRRIVRELENELLELGFAGVRVQWLTP